MARNFKELEARMSPRRRAKVRDEARGMMSAMLLAELRNQLGMTQAELADTLGIKQPSLSKIENQNDMRISTLRRIVEALGGELEVTVKLPGGTVKLGQFADPATA